MVLEEVPFSREDLQAIKKIFIVACGASFHAAMVGKHLIEGMCRLPVEVDLGSEFRYRDPMLDDDEPLDPHFPVRGNRAHGRTHHRRGTGGEKPGHRQCGGVEYGPGQRTAFSTPMPARRSGSPPPRRSPPSSWLLYLLAL